MDNRSLLEKFLPTEQAQYELLPYLSHLDISYLARTSKSLYHLFKTPLLIAQAEKVAHYIIVEPTPKNKEKVIDMLMHKRELIHVVIPKIKDHVGRIIRNKTLFQLAYGAGDDGLCSAMAPVFLAHYGSNNAAITEMERQRGKMSLNQQEAKTKEQEQVTHLKKILDPVITAISSEEFNLGKDAKGRLILHPTTVTTIEMFRKAFAKSQSTEIDHGMHFCYNILLEAYRIWQELTKKSEYDYKKFILFQCSVLSVILSYLPKNDMNFLYPHYIFRKSFLDLLNKPSSYFTNVGCTYDITLQMPFNIDEEMNKTKQLTRTANSISLLTEFITNKTKSLEKLTQHPVYSDLDIMLRDQIRSLLKLTREKG